MKSGVGAALAMGIIGWLGAISHEPMLIAPFGASCVLLFSVPNSPLAQPMNVIGGHMVASLIALTMRMALPGEWWAIALAVGVVIAIMALLRIIHPPAGADPVVIFLADPGWTFLLVPIFTGSLVLVAVATLIHLIPPHNTPYPKSWTVSWRRIKKGGRNDFVTATRYSILSRTRAEDAHDGFHAENFL